MPAPMPVCAVLCMNRASFSDFHDGCVCGGRTGAAGALQVGARPGGLRDTRDLRVYRWISGAVRSCPVGSCLCCVNSSQLPIQAPGVSRGICMRLQSRVASKTGLTPGRRFQTLPSKDLLGRFPPPYWRLFHGVVALQIEPDSRASGVPRHGWLAVRHRALCGGPGQTWPHAGTAAGAE